MCKSKINKTVIGMCHLLPLPGDYNYDTNHNISYIISRAKREINILQNNQISGILFSNEFSYPYTRNASPLTVAAMTRIISELRCFLNVPFGIDCMYDSISTIDIAFATESDFFRITLPKYSLVDFEFGYTEFDKIMKHISNIDKAHKTKMLLNIMPSLKSLVSPPEIEKFIKCVMQQIDLDYLCISAEYIHKYRNLSAIKENKSIIFCDGGCNADNLGNIYNSISGIVIGTALKYKSKLDNQVNNENVKTFMSLINNKNNQV